MNFSPLLRAPRRATRSGGLCPRRARALSGLLLGIAVGTTQIAYAQALPKRERVRAAISSLTPSYVLNGQPGIYAHSGRPPSIDLMGFNLAQEGNAIDHDVPELRAGKPLDITAYVKKIGVMASGAQLRVIIRGPGYGPSPSFLQTYPMDRELGPTGCVVKLPLRLELPTRTFVGPGNLTISEILPREPADQWAVLCTFPVNVPAVSWPSQTGEAPFTKFFGNYCVRLGQSFRLAPGASITLPATGIDGKEITAIGLVSCYAYDADIGQGEPVCRCELIDAAGKVLETVHVAAGISTAFDLYDDLQQDERHAKPIPVAFTEPVGGADSSKRRSHYAGRIALTNSVTPAAVVFTFVRDIGALDVDDVALIYASRTNPSA